MWRGELLEVKTADYFSEARIQNGAFPGTAARITRHNGAFMEYGRILQHRKKAKGYVAHGL